ncbi:MOSC domain-containing protein [Vogesella indigofera]|uniref:MOSC domain-containing protein n=1 Tax=Vogesella indigofera TaxID=45465 RepID=A0ABT5HZ58_VOGIN|nr:MOSC N-terminal beta barrel domain-containing protein [Vogesella indigofera]MDC7689205.1 MOSC domain-containing protein [Vogesella indigofera]
MALTQLFVHPLKSCRGNALQRAEVTPQGLRDDRVWLASRADGQFISARSHPRLVQVGVTRQADGQWCFTASGMPPLLTSPADYRQRVPATVWKSAFSALHGDAAADAWLSHYLGEPLRLLWLGDSTRVQKTTADRLSFADGYPYLLLSEASLLDLNSRLAQPVTMRHFRPNLVVDDTFAFEEDEWRRFRIGAVEFEVVSRCTRCVLTTVDPDSAQPDPQRQPLATLLGYRRLEEGVCFGVNVIARNSGTLQLGDAVEVLDSALAFD